ncbi:hypothetical protein GEMMAAP_08590 [Gemmatimonas phototrophica]|uniref:Uncharacterized protein n=2 Tax=Gemmatimonas phototrophica TaxID=1379270 RepID=A0A143BIK8_9BACT|nr:hypothetical protein GEMMAAP_08590 [Gemmatimonas phototrophica]
MATAAPAARRATPLAPQVPVAVQAPTPVRATGAVMAAQPTPVNLHVVVEQAQPGQAAPSRPATPLASPAVAAPAPAPMAAPVASPVTVTSATPYPVPAMATPAAGTPAAGKKPINPFLRADPSQRARRLARALVSDLVAYHPQKREEGLRDGTLRQLFREEIKKSYEEYVEQVGREVAESAPHFQEALNEILAGGRRLF